MTLRNLLRVLVVDDNESVRRSLCQLLRSEPNVEIVSEAVDGADAVAKTRAYLPDVVLLDITMPTMNGLEAARIIWQEVPSSQFVIVSQYDFRGFQWAVLSSGAVG